MKSIFPPLAGILLLAISATAAEPLPLAHLVRGEPFAGKLAGIDPERNLSLAAEGKERVLALADLALWGTYRDASTRPPPPAPRRQAEVVRLPRRGVAEPLSIPLAKVAALVLSAAQSPSIKARSPARLGMKDGSLLAARKLGAEKDQITLELQGGGVLK